MTFHPDLEQAWADEEVAPLAPHVAELDGRTFQIQPLVSYWYGHNGERSLRIVWSRRVDVRRTPPRRATPISPRPESRMRRAGSARAGRLDHFAWEAGPLATGLIETVITLS
jgi:hypothetical protein